MQMVRPGVQPGRCILRSPGHSYSLFRRRHLAADPDANTVRVGDVAAAQHNHLDISASVTGSVIEFQATYGISQEYGPPRLLPADATALRAFRPDAGQAQVRSATPPGLEEAELLTLANLVGSVAMVGVAVWIGLERHCRSLVIETKET